ncbi:hypothetical protein SAMD00019534_027340 [Acytostelium subglobosum LB1]|uniref:hypothetical protein n=1 Tax=Acytostelium subglobosum LB1 TaxID=1410327 RepID=UPI000644F338|nr:hypothetical protein SAMD00019534_027340 [Acytostelium subglobosum LB1]GAM19559.1 hypothetical protein SAMD00019534_027340 [Acytostelium subglobosum LB1]|eukprot:XP_012757486.1 hypothetical protein SAMD00019534_027340 [Acytostelium subglobosum LB1]
MYRNTVSEKIRGIAQQALEKYQGKIPSSYTWEEIANHNQRDDFWTVVNGYVYDLTAYLMMHPGGFNFLFRCAGANATADFEAMYHSKNAKLILECFCIGRVAPGSIAPSSSSSTLAPTSSVPFKQPFLKPSAQPLRSVQSNTTSSSSNNNNSVKTIITPTQTTPQPVTTVTAATVTITQTKRPSVMLATTSIVTKKQITSDTYMIEMKPPGTLKSDDWMRPLTHVSLARLNDEEFRSYTPIGCRIESTTELKNEYYLQFMIKGYESGDVSKSITQMNVGDSLQIKGPIETNDSFNLHTYSKPYIIGIAGGTGITPMLQILNDMFDGHQQQQQHQSKDDTMITQLSITTTSPHMILVYSNKTQSDILYRQELEALQQRHPNRLTIYYCLTQQLDGANADGLVGNFRYGRISREMLVELLSHHSSVTADNNDVLVCGTVSFNQTIKQHIESIGYNSVNSKIHLLE